MKNYYSKEIIEKKQIEKQIESEHINEVLKCLNSVSASTNTFYIQQRIDDTYSKYDSNLSAYTISSRTIKEDQIKLEHKVKSNVDYDSLYITLSKYNYMLDNSKIAYYSNSNKEKNEIYICNLTQNQIKIDQEEVSIQMIQFENSGRTEKVEKPMVKIPKNLFHHFRLIDNRWLLCSSPIINK